MWKQELTHRKRALRLLASFSGLLIITLGNLSCFFSPKEDREKLEETKRIWAAFPLHPAMQELHSNVQSGLGKAYISKTFRCDEKYEIVRSFYMERLTQNGWKANSEKQLSDWGKDVGGIELEFQKAEFQINIQFAGERADYGWDYGITIGWDNPVFHRPRKN
jgi:hypothetical protein